MFNRKKNIDQILSSLNENITDLEAHANDKEQEREQLLSRINEMEVTATEAARTCGRARIIAGKLRELISA